MTTIPTQSEKKTDKFNVSSSGHIVIQIWRNNCEKNIEN